MMRDLVSSIGNVAHQIGVGFGYLPRNVKTRLDTLIVQHVQDARRGDAGAVFGHGQQAGVIGKIGIPPQPRRHPIHVKSNQSNALNIIRPNAGH